MAGGGGGERGSEGSEGVTEYITHCLPQHYTLTYQTVHDPTQTITEQTKFPCTLINVYLILVISHTRNHIFT